MTRGLMALIVTVLLTAPAFAVEVGDVTFFAPFEGTFDAAHSGGAPEATAINEVTLVEGVRGGAARLAADAALEYIFAGNAIADEGTVMLWFRPEWPAEDDQFHHLFAANTGNDRGKSLNALQLYKYGRWSRLMFYTSNGELTGPQEGRTMAYREDMSWELGTWHHVAATWSSSLTSTEMYLYFDGERIAAGGGQIFVPDEAAPVFRIGEDTPTAPTEIDDVLVFRRPLLQREIEEIYASYKAAEVADARDLPFRQTRELLLRPFVNFGKQKVVTLVDYRGALRDLGERAGEVALSIDGVAGEHAATANTSAEGLARIEFDYDALGAGPATLTASLRAGDETLRTGQMAWSVPERPEWLGNTLGVTDEVLPPWTPLHASGDTVSVWGRKYAFDDSPLPAQVSSQASALLRGPIELRASSGGADATLQAQPAAQMAATDARATQQWTGAAGPVACTASTSLEFDGFMRVDMELTAGAAVDTLEIVVPMRPEAATLYHHCASDWTDASDAGDTGEPGWSKSLPFVPYVWLGNEDAGLAWWCETDWNWRNANEERAIELRHTADGVDLIVRVIDTPTTLDEPLKLTFGFLATPVKPLPDDFRNWRPMFISSVNIDGFAARNTWRQEGARNIGVLWASHVGVFNYLPTDPVEMARKVEVLHNAGWDTMTSYYALNATQTGTPDFTLMEQEWRRDPYSEAPAALGTHGAVCQAASWADMLLWIVNETMDQTSTDGIYLDCSSPRFCSSSEHGCAPGRYPILATRDLQKRLYALVHTKRPETGFVYSHVSENVFMTTYTYADAILNGEQYNRKDLLTDLTLAKFRAEFLPHNTGVTQILLPTLNKFQPSKDHEKMPGREFLAYPLLHDVLCVPSWMNRESQIFLRSVEDVQMQFGVADARFLPYWSNEDAIGVSADGALVSAYHREDAPGVLLIAQAPTEEPLELALTLKGELAGLTGLAARDALTGEALPWRDGKLVWPLPGRAVQLAIVE